MHAREKQGANPIRGSNGKLISKAALPNPASAGLAYRCFLPRTRLNLKFKKRKHSDFKAKWLQATGILGNLLFLILWPRTPHL